MPKILLRVLVALAAAGWTAIAPTAAPAQTTPLVTRPIVTSLGPDFPKTAIFIGNSFFYHNNGMQNHLLRLQRAADPDHNKDYRATLVAIGGSNLAWHDVESYFRPNAIGSYSFEDDNDLVFTKRDKLFDIAVMIDCSRCPIHPKLGSVFTDSARNDAEIVRGHGARPVFFMSWAYADKPEMTAQLAEAYTAAGNENNALVIPAGLAFARARQRQPELNLYAADKRHPSLAGTYLAACTTFAALTGRSPVDNSYLAAIDEPTARLLQTVAWETVQDYYQK